MAVCSFCDARLFRDPHWQTEHSKPHHESLTEWKAAVNNSCTICTLLLEHVKTALERHNSREREDIDDAGKGAIDNKRDSHPSAKAEDNIYRDKRVRERTVEDALLEWMTDQEEGFENLLPIYKVSFYDAGGRNAWLLKFQPRSETLFDGCLSRQHFFVYSIDYDGKRTKVELEDSTDSETTFKQIGCWVKGCEEHDRCQYLHKPPDDSAYVPLRLLDLGESEKDPIRIIKTGKKTSKYRPYITLSYKWGYEPLRTAILNDTNYVSFTRGLDETQLPQTFRDAISATRRLGVRWLWIDALCMQQQDTAEWMIESLKMRSVYANSFLSLAATSGDNYQQGLFRRRDPRAAAPATVRVAWAHHELDCHIVREDFWRGELLSEPLYLRGWVLQERLLAPRVLHFHRRQLVWQCPGLTASERAPRGLSKILDDERRDELRWRQLVNREDGGFTRAQKADLHDIWRFIVGTYTRCRLTKRGDRLMALAGVAQRMRMAFEEKYIAGLWERDLVEQLAWKVVEFRPREADATYVAPSWAWVSADGAVSVPARVVHRRDYRMRIPENGWRLVLQAPDDDEGKLYFGSLTAETQMYRLVFAATSLEQTEWSWVRDAAGHGEGSWCRFYPDTPIDGKSLNQVAELEDSVRLYRYPTEDDPEHRLECSAAMLVYQQDRSSNSMSGYALALKSNWAGLVKAYSRIGLIEFHGLGADSWKEMHSKRRRRKQNQDDVAPSDDRADDMHFITLI